MKIKIWSEMVDAIKATEEFEELGWRTDTQRWSKRQEFDISGWSKKSLEQLLKLAQRAPKAKGAATVIAGCEFWLKTMNGKELKIRSVELFSSMLRQHLLASISKNVAAGRPGIGPRLYKKDAARDVWLCHYVSEVRFIPEKKRDGYVTEPASTLITLNYQHFGDREHDTEDFESQHCNHMTVTEALAKRGLFVETDELWAEYQRRHALFEKWHDKIGMQFFVAGVASDDCDGNDGGRRDSWYWKKAHSIDMEAGGERSRAVVDVFFEQDREERRHNHHYHDVDANWWSRKHNWGDAPESDGEEEDAGSIYLNEEEENSAPLIPLHPMLAVFDLKRQKRLRVDVGQLEPYVYDATLGEKLVLPPESRSLVEMLLAFKGQFTDIVKGKSGGSIILCAGLPGTGKTLTSEIYSEVTARPLYTVQASQLGVEPETLEENLLKAFARATRWKAIMLIDEADVYVHTRGNDLTQNAIVGVFLRVLEYFAGVLFLTTNRADLVDDAIASRCVARIDYGVPSAVDQKRIWQILSETSGVPIAADVIDAVVAQYPKLTGRDVKNLLKLAYLVAKAAKKPIDVETIERVMKFRQSRNEKEDG